MGGITAARPPVCGNREKGVFMRERNNGIELNREICLAVKNNEPVSEIIGRMNYEEIKTQTITAAASPDYAEALFDYVNPENFTGSIKEVCWALSALEAALPSAAKLSVPKKTVVYDNFITLMLIYVNNAYNPDMLTAENARLLPKSHRFGHYMGEARKSLDDSDKAGCVKLLKLALEADNSKSDIVSLWLGEL